MSLQESTGRLHPEGQVFETVIPTGPVDEAVAKALADLAASHDELVAIQNGMKELVAKRICHLAVPARSGLTIRGATTRDCRSGSGATEVLASIEGSGDEFDRLFAREMLGPEVLQAALRQSDITSKSRAALRAARRCEFELGVTVGGDGSCEVAMPRCAVGRRLEQISEGLARHASIEPRYITDEFMKAFAITATRALAPVRCGEGRVSVRNRCRDGLAFSFSDVRPDDAAALYCEGVPSRVLLEHVAESVDTGTVVHQALAWQALSALNSPR
ncbi:hypothetical protein [Sinomonas susongensis]|uniref:hypothetical protein n=1 Tax=Sinomonas susongensis TaxID=1324851 RepID=UPI001109D061|nr:hypothetical protein [Sinomonas susongensis]